MRGVLMTLCLDAFCTEGGLKRQKGRAVIHPFKVGRGLAVVMPYYVLLSRMKANLTHDFMVIRCIFSHKKHLIIVMGKEL